MPRGVAALPAYQFSLPVQAPAPTSAQVIAKVKAKVKEDPRLALLYHEPPPAAPLPSPSSSSSSTFVASVRPRAAKPKPKLTRAATTTGASSNRHIDYDGNFVWERVGESEWVHSKTGERMTKDPRVLHLL
jgi:hypothetical protein